jgi:hypothetical protein
MTGDPPKGQVIALPTIVVRSASPENFMFGHHYLLAGKKLEPTGPRDLVPYFLVCHALELFSKAFLMVKARSREQARKECWHDFYTCLAKCEARGLSDLVPITEEVRG